MLVVKLESRRQGNEEEDKFDVNAWGLLKAARIAYGDSLFPPVETEDGAAVAEGEGVEKFGVLRYYGGGFWWDVDDLFWPSPLLSLHESEAEPRIDGSSGA